jgi:hypothetical protein
MTWLNVRTDGFLGMIGWQMHLQKTLRAELC